MLKDFTIMNAYASAKRVLRKNPPLDDGIGLILAEGNRVCPSRFWQQCRKLKVGADVRHVVAFYEYYKRRRMAAIGDAVHKFKALAQPDSLHGGHFSVATRS